MPLTDEFVAFVVSHVCHGDEFNDAAQKALKPRAQKSFESEASLKSLLQAFLKWKDIDPTLASEWVAMAW